MVNKELKTMLEEVSKKNYQTKVVTGLDPCDKTCVDWPRDPGDKTKRCSYCIPTSLLANQKREK